MNLKRRYSLQQIVESLQSKSLTVNLQNAVSAVSHESSNALEFVVDGIANLEKAEKTHLSFLSNPRYLPFLETTHAAAVLVKQDIEVPHNLNVLRVDDPYLAYAYISGLFSDRVVGTMGIHPSAVVDSTAQVHPSASIGANCVVGPHAKIGQGTELQAGVVIGACTTLGVNCLIYANATIYHGVTLGDRVIIHSGSAIGSDGFGYSPSVTGWVKIHQLGGVFIGNDVEIGSCTSIDRGAIEDTFIDDGVIIDNQVHIAHNVHIGKRTAIAGCVGIAGSTKIGADCTMGGFVAINGHLTIADNVHFNGGTVVTKSISEAGAYSSGTLIQDVKTWRKNAVRCSQLESWVDRIKELEKANK